MCDRAPKRRRCRQIRIKGQQHSSTLGDRERKDVDSRARESKVEIQQCEAFKSINHPQLDFYSHQYACLPPSLNAPRRGHQSTNSSHRFRAYNDEFCLMRSSSPSPQPPRRPPPSPSLTRKIPPPPPIATSPAASTRISMAKSAGVAGEASGDEFVLLTLLILCALQRQHTQTHNNSFFTSRSAPLCDGSTGLAEHKGLDPVPGQLVPAEAAGRARRYQDRGATRGEHGAGAAP